MVVVVAAVAVVVGSDAADLAGAEGDVDDVVCDYGGAADVDEDGADFELLLFVVPSAAVFRRTSVNYTNKTFNKFASLKLRSIII